MNRNSRLTNHLVTLLTLGTIFPILFVRLVDLQSTIFWLYSVSITGFLLFMYTTTSTYHPQQDQGHRPKVAVIIPAKNEEDAIEAVVRSIFNSNYPSSKLEVIAVDDGSTDRTWENLQRLKRDPQLSDRLHLIRHERNYGKRVALASGAALSTSEIIICIDSDSFVDRDAVKNLVQPFQDSNITAVCGHGQAANMNEGLLAKLQHYWYAEMFRLWKGMESKFGCVTCCSGILSAYRRATIQPLLNQWLGERFPNKTSADVVSQTFPITGPLTSRLIKSPGEDRVLTAAALSGNHARAVYQSNAVVYTIVPDTFRIFLRQQLRWMRSWVHCSLLQGRFMWRKRSPMAFIFYLYQFLAYLSPAVAIIWLLIKPLEGEWLGTAGFLAGTLYVGALHGLNTWKYLRTSIESVVYRTMFVFLFLFLTVTVVVYGWSTPWKGGWLTREQEPKQLASPAPANVEPVIPEPLPALA